MGHLLNKYRHLRRFQGQRDAKILIKKYIYKILLCIDQHYSIYSLGFEGRYSMIYIFTDIT